MMTTEHSMKLIVKASLSVIVTIALAGCGGFSGLGASSSFSCKAPAGVLCESMSGVYANAAQHNLPGQAPMGRAEGKGDIELSRAKTDGVLTEPLYSGTPIRSAPRVLRVWFAPWEDSDGDLHDQSYVYLPIDSGHWLVEHNRRRIQNAYAPVRPPAKAGANPGSAKAIAESNVQAGSASARDLMSGGQSRPSPQEAAAMLGNIQLPSQLGQPSTQKESE